ncbi:adenylate/guanylate cyclase domain-containing protein [Ruegeria marina]|uniref:TolB amino-terminal domain-containing protein n=1 Tax=Ruegeria marina TaxID=639004 RepID=A0A1G6VPZ0_9RHOB|nr:adenylate/guanylate cyclase domain-containing protein [Ruegeria marina]SDD55648.1 TolB amino-terminal domain-containing protein [Ruegeria marina]
MERRLAAILAADVVGFSRMMAEDEAGTFKRLTEMRQDLVARIIADKNGRIVKLMGDGLLLEFPSVVDAVEAAIEIQSAVSRRNAGAGPANRIELRIGVNMGDLIIDGDDIYGEGVNIAARLEPLARPGGICISREVYEYTRGKVSKAFEPAGVHRVKNIPEPIAVYQVADQAAENPSRKRSYQPVRNVVALVVAIVFSMAGFFYWSDKSGFSFGNLLAWLEPGNSDQPSLVVLPFENHGLSADESYLADGLTDDLITDFSKLSGLMVIGSNTAFSYKGGDADSREVGRELGVRHVLEGSMRRTGGRIRVNVRLIETDSGKTLWADRYDRDASEMFAIEDEIVHQALSHLKVEITASEKRQVGKLPTTNLEAYDYFLRAEEAARSGFRPDLREALRLYARATALDPGFARAYSSRARTEALIMRRNYDDILAYPVARKQAYEHAGRALTIDPEAASPFAVLSELQTVDRHFEEALRSAQRAVETAPGEAAAHLALSFVNTFAGRHQDAIAQFELARRLNPLLPAYSRQVASLSYILNGQPESAVEILEEIRESSQGVEDYLNILATAYSEAGQSDRAQVIFEDTLRFAPHTSAELYRILFDHFRKPADLDRIIDAMLRAGLQKWPFGFRSGSDEPLSGKEISNLLTGVVWRGTFEGRGPGLLQISQSGTMALRFPSMFATGTAQVRGDQLCLRQPGLALGREVCGPVYKTDPPMPDALLYTYVNAHFVFHFMPDG